jgi:hypothetical protein
MTASMLREILARLVRLREAAEDGEIELSDQIGIDLEHDVARWIRQLERGS